MDDKTDFKDDLRDRILVEERERERYGYQIDEEEKIEEI